MRTPRGGEGGRRERILGGEFICQWDMAPSIELHFILMIGKKRTTDGIKKAIARVEEGRTEMIM